MRTALISRRGNYSILMALAIGTILGFGALATDVTLIRLAQNQTQDVADAASQAALVQLRRTGDAARAEEVAEEVVARNNIVEAPGELVSLDWGAWDASSLTFDTTVGPADGANAVIATVAREGANEVPSLLGSYFGVNSYATRRSSTSAMRTLEAVLVMDITASWDQDNFYKARDAALAFLDELNANHGESDVIGMTVFHSRYGWEWTPFTEIDGNYDTIRDQWDDLNVGNLAGTPQATWATDATKHIACSVFGSKLYNHGKANPFSWCSSSSSTQAVCSTNGSNWYYGASCCTSFPKMNDFTEGQCFPQLPRYYRDESGTDHSTGMEMALTMFEERHNPMAYRAAVVLTDGEPISWNRSAGLSAASWDRDDDAFVEPYRQYTAPVNSRSEAAIQTSTLTVADSLWTEDVNLWFVSFVYDRPYFEDIPKGDGYYARAETASEIEPIFVQIARSLPSAIVE